MTQEKLDNQREVVKNERRWAVDNQPYGTWDERIQAALFPEGHPYHHPDDRLDGGPRRGRASRTFPAFFATYYAPNNAVLTVAGDFEPAAALAMIERHFGPIPANPSLPPAPDMTIQPILGGELRESVPDACSLPRVYLAYRMPVFGTDAWDDLSVAADLLGVGRASRLYRVLVRERQLAQDVTVFPFPVVGGASMFTIWATARPGIDPADLEAAVLAEVDRLSADGPSDDELERVRNLHAAAVESSLERSSRARRSALDVRAACSTSRNGSTTRSVATSPSTRDASASAMSMVLRADNRLSLTYLPERQGGRHTAAGDEASS